MIVLNAESWPLQYSIEYLRTLERILFFKEKIDENWLSRRAISE